MKKNGKGRKNPVLDLRKTGQVGMAQPKPIVLTDDAWRLLQDRCRELNDDEFHILRTYKHYIEFSLTDHDGKPQRYRIRAVSLKRTKTMTGKRLLAVFLIFDRDGLDIVDTAQFWFEPFKVWLKYWAGQGPHPKEVQGGAVNVQQAVKVDEQIRGFQRFSER